MTSGINHFVCACKQRDDSIIAYYDEDFKEVNLNFVTNCSEYNGDDSFYEPRYFYKRIWWRIITAIKLLFTGYAKFEGAWLVDKEDELEQFISYLNECHNQMKKGSK